MKKVSVFLVLVLLLLGLGTAQAMAESDLSLGVIGGLCLPGYGDVNEDFELINDIWGTDIGFGSCPILGFTASYSLTSNFRLGGEIARFSSATSDSQTITGSYWWWWYYTYWEETLDITAKVTVIPVMFTATYTFPVAGSWHPFIGGAVGQFLTTLEMEVDMEYEEWTDGWYYYDKASADDKDTDWATAFQFRGGVERELRDNISYVIEGRYTVAEADVRLRDIGYETEIDLGGLTIAGMIIVNL